MHLLCSDSEHTRGSNCYPVGSKRGRAIVIANENFDPETGRKPRSGADDDLQQLKTMFIQLGFETYAFKDLSWSDMTKEVTKRK